MTNHIISKDQLEDFEAVSRLAGQHGKGVNKSLDMHVNPVLKRVWFVVKSHKKEVGVPPELDEAIDLYNKL